MPVFTSKLYYDNTCMSIVVQLVVGKLELVEGDDLLSPLRTRGR